MEKKLTKEQKDSILGFLSNFLKSSDGIKHLASLVYSKELTIEELQDTGELTTELRKKIEDEVKELQKIDVACSDANDKKAKKEQVLEALKNNINAYRSEVLRSHYNITIDDLVNAGINIPKEIRDIYDSKCVELSLGEIPNQIVGDNTEVYFWGVPGSGKTCTLAAILKSANIVENSDIEGSGLRYFQTLANVFNNGVGTLPPGTEKQKYQTYTFDLLDSKKNHYPMTFIDLPGELFSDFTLARRDPNFIDTKQSVKDFLYLIKNNKNPKYHFFIIDVCNNDIDSVTQCGQSQLLANAASYFEKNNIFNEKTAGIAIIVTKSDILSLNEDECYRKATELLNSNYNNFISTIKSIAKSKNLISKESDPIDLIPFSIGTVYLQDKCVYSDKKPKEVIKYLIEHVAHKKKRNIFRFLNN